MNELPAKYRVGSSILYARRSVAAPATRNREPRRQAPWKLTAGGGTALGDGIVTALNVGRAVPRDPGRQKEQAGDVPPTTVILFTDGLQEGGEVTRGGRAEARHPAARADQRRPRRQPIRDRQVPRVGGFVQFIRVPADASELKQIAKSRTAASTSGRAPPT